MLRGHSSPGGQSACRSRRLKAGPQGRRSAGAPQARALTRLERQARISP